MRSIISNVIRTSLNILLMPFVMVICLISRFIRKKIDIGIGPIPLINNVYWKKALETKGYKVETYVNAIYFITDEFDYVFDLEHSIIYSYFPVLLFARTVLRYKAVYIYFNGGPLQVMPVLRGIEPLLFKLANVKVVVMPYGSDSQLFDRTPNKLTVHTLCQDYPQFFKNNYLYIQKSLIRWSKYADVVVGSMDSIDYMHYWDVLRQCHYAIDVERIQPVYATEKENKTIRILHAPNHKSIKGTRYIEKAINELKEEGYQIEYVFQQGIPNSELIKLIQSADIVVDQLIMGWYAMFAMEAMAAGKPTICYLRQDLVDLYEKTECVEQGEIPLISAQVDNIKDVLRELIDKKNSWNEIGIKSRKYVEKYHSLESVGSFFDEINRKINIR